VRKETVGACLSLDGGRGWATHSCRPASLRTLVTLDGRLIGLPSSQRMMEERAMGATVGVRLKGSVGAKADDTARVIATRDIVMRAGTREDRESN
jgi:hypothetical protein